MSTEIRSKENKTTAGRPKSTEKQQQILLAASCLFLRQGFSATSMDNVAKEANVSKQTVYSHYKNKDALFTAVIALKCHEYQMNEEHILQSGRDLKAALCLLGEQFVSLLHDEDVISMYRLIAGEVGANIHVAKLFFDAGPDQAIQMLVKVLLAQDEISFNQEDVQYFTMVFFNLLKGEYHMKSLMGLPGRLSEQEQSDFVARVVDDYIVILRSERSA